MGFDRTLCGFERRRLGDMAKGGAMSNIPAEPVVVKSPCIVCLQPIPTGAKVCTNCKEYQNWRRHFAVTSIIVAFVGTFISVIAALVPSWSYFLDRHSHTRFKVTSSDENHVY